MATRLLQIYIGITIFKVISSQFQPSVKQYIIRGSQSQQSYNQQPVVIERISALPSGSTTSLGPSGSANGNLIGSSGTYYTTAPIGSTSMGSTGSISTNLFGPSGTFVTTGPMSSSGSIGTTGSIGTSLYGPLGSSGSLFTAQTVNGQIVANGLASGSLLSPNPNVASSVLTSLPGLSSGKSLADLSGVLNGLQTLKSISDKGFGGMTTLSSESQTGSSLNSLTDSLPNGSPKGLDTTVLNNLAIALQLLILSNMLNGESPETVSETEPSLFEIIEPLPVKQLSTQASNMPSQPNMNHYEQYFDVSEPKRPQSEPLFPNCNFVGSSGFTESPMLGLPPKSLGPAHPRSGKCLMSPYEALGNTHEPFGSSYRGFESPYSAISDNNDLFCMNDLF